MNLNQLAKRITEKEGKKTQVNIAQVKEIINVIGQIFNELDWCGTVDLVNSMKKVGKKKRK